MGARLLVLEAGSAPGNNLIRSLKAGDRSLTIVGCNDSQFFLKKSPARRNYLLPLTTSAFAAALRCIVDAEDIDLVIPTSDAQVLRLAKLRGKLRRKTFLPALKLIERCQDKYELTVFLRARGIPAPLTYPVRDLRRIGDIFERFQRGAKLWCRIRSGSGSYGAIPVRTPRQVRGWIEFWQGMRGVPAGAFTLSEYLPGRDFCVQSLWQKGKMVLAKMAERITYLNTGSPSGMSSMPALAKTAFDARAIGASLDAIRALDANASGVFFIDMKENEAGDPCITEINAGRFATMTNIHDLAGRHNMAATYVRLALGQRVKISSPFDFAEGYYLVRSVDTTPMLLSKRDLFRGVKEQCA